MPDHDHTPPTPDELSTTPALYPLTIDHFVDSVQFVRLSKDDYAAANFLDRRMLRPDMQESWRSWPGIRTAAAGLPARAHFIFHISHVGSTLLSRLVGRHPAFFSLREPAVLRALAQMRTTLGRPSCPWSTEEFDRRIDVFLSLWSRTFEPTETVVIKATSFVSEMADDLMGRVPASRSVFMYVSPRVFLPTLLGGAMVDIDSGAESRLGRLSRRLGESVAAIADLPPGRRVAVSWLTEMLSLKAAAARSPDRVLWLDFDEFLGDPERGLIRVLHHFGATDTAPAGGIVRGPTMRQYSKGPERGFDAETRSRLLAQATRQHAAEIGHGLEWLDAAAHRWPAVAELLNFCSHDLRRG